VCTLNEPNIVSLMGHYLGVFPPGKRDLAAYDRANDTVIRAHRLAYDAIKAGPGDAPVGLTLSMQDFQTVPGGEDRMHEARQRMEDVFLEAVRGDDYIGAQMYSRLRWGPDGILGPEEGVRTTLMGYEFWPQALEATVRRAAEVAQVPIYVTENGIGTDDDRQRVRFIANHLASVREAMDAGADIRGYLYWCSVDNFEWTFGYNRNFGLIACDRETYQRMPKPSADYFGELCRTNAVDPATTATFLAR